MPSYSEGKIYAVKSKQIDKIYIGSTCQKINKRFGEHKSRYLNSDKNDDYKNRSVNEILKFDDAYIELLENFPCNNGIELKKREGEFIKSNNCVNKLIAGRTNKEWDKENQDKVKEYKRNWYIKYHK